MSSQLTVLRHCADRIEAETIRIRLASAEIQVLITGTDAGTALGLGGAATSRMVRVEVASSDYDRANDLLNEDAKRTRLAGPWVCVRCHERNESAFDVCWCCNQIRQAQVAYGREDNIKIVEAEGGLSPTRAPTAKTERMIFSSNGNNAGDDQSPHRSVWGDPNCVTSTSSDLCVIDHDEPADAVTRCIRSAIVGALVLPPLVSLYSIYLLLRLDPIAYRTPSFRVRILLAWIINVLMMMLSLTFWFLI